MISRILSELPKEIPVYTGLIANIVVISGAIPAFMWLKNLSFERKTQEIQDNLSIKKDIKEKLREHVDSYDRSTRHDIGIRLVYWKNYPWQLDDDGYKQLLYYDTNLDKSLYHGTEFLTNTGILVEEHIWHSNHSLYLGRYGTYIITTPGKDIPAFDEVDQKIKLVTTLKYKDIVNWDFEERIEYEPTFYTKYKYTNKRLFENQFFAQNDDGGVNQNLSFRESLNRHRRVKSSRSLKYRLLMLRGYVIARKNARKS